LTKDDAEFDAVVGWSLACLREHLPAVGCVRVHGEFDAKDGRDLCNEIVR